MDSARTIDLSNSPPLRQPAPLPQKGLHSRFPPLNLPTGSANQIPTTPPQGSNSGYDSPPRTPKGHPVPMNNHDYLSRSSLIGFLGGGGNGNTVTPVGGARRQSAAGSKFYPPDQTSQRSSFTSTVSYLTRGIPRRVRTPLLMLLALTLLATVGLKIAHERADTLERMQAEKFAANLAKAYVVDSASAAAHGDKSAGAAGKDVVLEGLQPETYMKNDVKERQAPVVVPFDSSEVEFEMSAREETAALIAFITSTSNNALPATLDPNEPLDPQLVLDFDYTRPATARDDLAALVYDTFHMYPVVLFGQMRDPYYREMRKLFSSYVVHPPPLVIEVDQRSDEDIIVGLLKRLLGIQELPVLMLNGKSAGSWAAIQETADNGSFMKLIATESSAKIQEKKLKKRPKGVKDAERAEKERILSPKPIMD